MLRERLTRFHLLLLGASLLLLIVLSTTSSRGNLVGCASVFLVTSVLAALGVARPQWQMFCASICSIPKAGRRVALTFDDGPDPRSTPALLELLARRSARATFFCIGQRAERHPDLIRAIAAGGHLIGNHTYSHRRDTNFMSRQRLHEDVEKTQTILEELTGQRPIFWRTPMGLTNGRVFRVARDLGLRVIGWQARGRDQGDPEPERIVRRLMRGVRPGAVLLLHDGDVPSERLVRSVELLIDKLTAHGYQCARLDTMLGEESIS